MSDTSNFYRSAGPERFLLSQMRISICRVARVLLPRLNEGCSVDSEVFETRFTVVQERRSESKKRDALHRKFGIGRPVSLVACTLRSTRIGGLRVRTVCQIVTSMAVEKWHLRLTAHQSSLFTEPPRFYSSLMSYVRMVCPLPGRTIHVRLEGTLAWIVNDKDVRINNLRSKEWRRSSIWTLLESNADRP